ncbi:MAG: hypothetical protein M1829_005828 [Trizodia sp. TS-e1964]|nr:MAG: hypothetical protein M1829_005828 [Trizodia sp. TS-e1964]
MPAKRRASTLIAPLASKRVLLPKEEASQDSDEARMKEARKEEARDNKMLLVQAMQWLEEYSDEKSATAARIFQISSKTVCSALTRKKADTNGQWGGHNKILTKAEEEAIHQFITDLLEHQILPTFQLIYLAISKLKHDEDHETPSLSWFTKWWKTPGLHQIKTKPIAAVRYTAHDAAEISKWFDNYHTIVNELEIIKHRVWNFDETGFQVGVSKGQRILVPGDIQEV